jgi:hypothetical protein
MPNTGKDDKDQVYVLIFLAFLKYSVVRKNISKIAFI